MMNSPSLRWRELLQTALGANVCSAVCEEMCPVSNNREIPSTEIISEANNVIEYVAHITNT
jgi:hypothetical protein